MDIFFFNIGWMIYNISLALIAVLCGYIMYKVHNRIFKLFFGFFWFLFVPNTMYMITDISHFFEELPKIGNNIFLYLIIAEYIVLTIVSILTFVLSLDFFEKTLDFYIKRKVYIWISLIVLCFFIGFGVSIGRVERLRSWDAIFDIHKVIVHSLYVFSSLWLMAYSYLFGVLANCLYFLTKDIGKIYKYRNHKTRANTIVKL